MYIWPNENSFQVLKIFQSKTIAKIHQGALSSRRHACLKSLGNLFDSGGNGLLAFICNCPAWQLLRKEKLMSHTASHCSTFVWLPRG